MNQVIDAVMQNVINAIASANSKSTMQAFESTLAISVPSPTLAAVLHISASETSLKKHVLTVISMRTNM